MSQFNTPVSVAKPIEFAGDRTILSGKMSTYNGALSVAGSGVFADRLGEFNDIPGSGLYVFRVESATGFALGFVAEGGAGATATATVFRANRIADASAKGASNYWTARHIGNIDIVATLHTLAAADKLATAGLRWCQSTPTSTGLLDGALPRLMQGQSLLPNPNPSEAHFDPVNWPVILVQVSRGTATRVIPYIVQWTGQ